MSTSFFIETNFSLLIPIAVIRYKYTPLAYLSMFTTSLNLPAFLPASARGGLRRTLVELTKSFQLEHFLCLDESLSIIPDSGDP
ncbi:MAG TPA: hypothetical protein VIS48_05050, partial [Candidatus Kryptonia bacterium]